MDISKNALQNSLLIQNAPNYTMWGTVRILQLRSSLAYQKNSSFGDHAALNEQPISLTEYTGYPETVRNISPRYSHHNSF